MSILIHLVNGNPEKHENETHAGLILARDEKLGWRCKLTAMPTKRELMRSVSDCPLTIAENILLWSKRHGWNIKLHPNSISLKQLLTEVKDYTGLGSPETNILAAAMLLKNFCPPKIQQQPGLPDFKILIESMQPPAQQPPRQQPQPQQQQQQQPEQPPQQWVGDGAAKMKRTQEKYKDHMESVNATVAYNEHKNKLASQVTENFEENMAELDELLNEFDDTTEDIPTTFNNKEEAIDWAVGIGAFENKEDAAEVYNEIQSEIESSDSKDIYPVWIESIMSIFDDGKE